MDTLPGDLEARRPVLTSLDVPHDARARRPTVLAVGVVLDDQLHTAADTARRLAEARGYDVCQRWVVVEAASGRAGPSPRPPAITLTTAQLRPKYELINEQLACVDLTRYDYLLVVDDDVIVPHGFVDAFLDLQTALRFVIAQPSRTVTSAIDHPIVACHAGLVGRQTWFVEQGPIVSFHRRVIADVVPFDLRSPMGWGFECVWSALVERRGLQMGVIDAVSVDHSIRPVLANYSFDEAADRFAALLAAVEHRPIDECMRVVRAIRTLP